MPEISLNVSFSDSYYKKLGLKGPVFENAMSDAIDHILHDAETIIKKEVPRPGHSMSTTGYQPTGNLQKSINKDRPDKTSGRLLSNARSKNNHLYWGYVNFGTSKMPANPFVQRTVKKVAPKAEEYVVDELKNAGVLE